MRNLVQKYGSIFAVAAVIVVLDQWTKSWVRINLPSGATWLPESLLWLSPYARIVHWYNTGAAFGMFKDASMILTILAFVVIGAILFYYPQVEKDDWLLRLALSMQLGGALGNLVDRLTVGHVTDFISVGNFPVFNIADASITIGAVLLFLSVWFRERAEKKAADQSVDIPGETTGE
ncbi:MAG: signal peptidase II [Syntrophothermus sp.]